MEEVNILFQCLHEVCTHTPSHPNYTTPRALQSHEQQQNKHPCPSTCVRCIHWKNKGYLKDSVPEALPTPVKTQRKYKPAVRGNFPCFHDGCSSVFVWKSNRFEHERNVHINACGVFCKRCCESKFHCKYLTRKNFQIALKVM